MITFRSLSNISISAAISALDLRLCKIFLTYSNEYAQKILLRLSSKSKISPRKPYVGQTPSLVSILGPVLLKFFGYTSRIKYHQSDGYTDLKRQKRPYILAFWHREQLILAFTHRNKGITVLVSQSRDGEYIAAIINKMGFFTARGSSSRGGFSAYNELGSRLEGGHVVAITPDGPRGPERSVQQGVIALAQSTGAPVVPLGAAARFEIWLKSWDRFIVPLPFNKLAVVHGQPIYLGPDIDSETCAEMVKNGLDEARDAAITLCGGTR